MSIEDFLIKTCVQTAVYWGNPQEDGFGTKTYDVPVEINCRWEEKVQLVKNEQFNTEILSRAEVFVLQDLDQQGILYLGTLDELDSGADVDPLSQEGAYIIKIFEKYPALNSSTVFIRKVYLSEYLF